MAATAGIKTIKNLKGQITHITVDVRKHKNVIPMFTDAGILPKTKFQLECERGTPLEEARQELLAYVRSFPWKK